MWNNIKRGFGLGFGGSIGWNLGNFIWRWVSRTIVAVLVMASLQFGGHSVKVMDDVKAKHSQVQHKSN